MVAQEVPLILEHYKIFLGKEQIGQAQFTQAGLYYLIKCRCKLPNDRIYGITAQCDDGAVFLGTCYPEGSVFLLQTRKPVKHFPGRVRHLDAALKSTGQTDSVTVIKESAPIDFLESIECTRLGKQNGNLGFRMQSDS